MKKRQSVRKRRPRPIRDRQYLEAHEAAVISRDIEAMGGSASASRLRMRYPMRYHERYLPGALKRMKGQGLVRTSGREGFRPVYYLTASGEQMAKAA